MGIEGKSEDKVWRTLNGVAHGVRLQRRNSKARVCASPAGKRGKTAKCMGRKNADFCGQMSCMERMTSNGWSQLSLEQQREAAFNHNVM